MTINSLTEEEFVKILKMYLSPAKPISSVELLHGRTTALRSIEKALYADGRHIFIYGERGVGKSSLAQTAATQYQSSDNDYILIECAPDTTFLGTINSIINKVLKKSSTTIETSHKAKLTAKLIDYEFNHKKTNVQSKLEVDTIDSASEAIREIGELHSIRPIIVIDEFDTIENEDERKKFAILLKHLGDKNIKVKFIFSGIGESLESLLGLHLSSIRQLETISLERLSWDARWEIIENAASALGVSIGKDILVRIAGITDGFPYYAHLIAEKLFWHLFESSDCRTEVSVDDYYAAIDSAIDGISPHLKRPYEKATACRDRQYSFILWAVADAYDLLRNNMNIYQSYERIMHVLEGESLDRTTFNRMLNTLKQKTSDSILVTVPSRKGWCRFRESMVRGYVRLLAESNGIQLDVESYDDPCPTKTIRIFARSKDRFRGFPTRPKGFQK